MRLKALAGVLLLSWSAAALAQAAAPAAPSPFKFEFHGFMAGTIALQDGQANGTGQLPYYAVAQPNADRLSFAGDVRESRANWSVSGPAVFGGATPRAVMEIDWFNNFGSGGSPISLLPRVRVMYAELNWGANRLIVGQNYDLTTLIGPTSLAHLAQPLHLGAGNLGFRGPGIQGYHMFGNLKDRNASRVEFAWQLRRAAWTDNSSGIGASSCAVTGALGGFCQGEAAGVPAVEARLAYYMGSNVTAFVAGHWARMDRNGVGADESGNTPIALRSIDQVAGVAGAKIVGGPLTAQAGGFVGKNVGSLSSAIGGQLSTAGDVHEYGVWGQLGFNFTKELSAWGFAGVGREGSGDLNEARNGGITRWRNIVYSALLQYRDGGYAMGLEWAHFRTNYFATPAGSTTDTPDVNQLAFTGAYFF